MSSEITMTSNKPYLIRGLHQWICDNQLTPYLLIKADHPELVVPKTYINDNKVVLNVSYAAVRNLNIENDFIMFNARFEGRDHSITIPITSVIAVYAKENGQGMLFPENDHKEDNHPDSATPSDRHPKKKRPELKVVK